MTNSQLPYWLQAKIYKIVSKYCESEGIPCDGHDFDLKVQEMIEAVERGVELVKACRDSQEKVETI